MIKELREKKHYTQEKMAKFLKISVRHYVRIDTEKVMPRADIFRDLVKYLEMTPKQIDQFILNVIDNKTK